MWTASEDGIRGRALALEVAAGADATAVGGTDTHVSLGTASAGVPAPTGYTGSHRWASAGTYPLRVLVSDSRSDVLTTLTVTVG